MSQYIIIALHVSSTFCLQLIGRTMPSTAQLDVYPVLALLIRGIICATLAECQVPIFPIFLSILLFFSHLLLFFLFLRHFTFNLYFFSVVSLQLFFFSVAC